MSSFVFLFATWHLILSLTSDALSKPHIVFVLSDDFGWANVEWHNQRMQTPHLMNLLSESLLLNDFYTYKFCAPSRASLLSGRMPYHVNEENGPECAPGFGIPPEMTTISSKLVNNANYIAHQIGKWHVGCSSNKYIPIGRNFTTSLGYICGWGEDHYTQIETLNEGSLGTCSGVDLYDTNKPAYNQNGTYGGYIYGNRALKIINQHQINNPNKPLFLYLATQNNHDPYEVPKEYEDKYNSSWYYIQRIVGGMSNFEDELVYNVTMALKNNGMWNNTLFIMVSDNGGQVWDNKPAYNPGKCGGNNYPMRGGKFSNFEGGVKVNALISGGYLPKHRRNKTLNGFVHIADIYSTLCSIVDINPTDYNAEKYNLPPIDSINMWPFWIGDTAISPRNEIFLSSGKNGGLISGDYKIIFGMQSPAFWTNLDYPNGTIPVLLNISCGSVEKGGCLFNIKTDPTEHDDIINETKYGSLVETMRQRFIEMNATGFHPNRGDPDPKCCEQIQLTGGYWAPWLN